MSKETLLKGFRSEFSEYLRPKTIGVFDSILLANQFEEYLEKAIDQTREETIKKTLKEIRDYIRDNEKLGYENRVLVGDEIYAKLSIIYDKSLINK